MRLSMIAAKRSISRLMVSGSNIGNCCWGLMR